MNLSVLGKSRRAPTEGDIFAMTPPDGLFLFGRVISTNGIIGPMTGCILIYVYDARSPSEAAIPPLSRDQLLVPPMMTNKLPWTKGYFKFVENRPLTPSDHFPVHSFARLWTTPVQYYDELGNRLEEPIEPVGEYGLQSFRTIDDKVSRALGIPLAPED